ncbi:MAG: IclR family transcriptional regulator [Bacillota bacterium]
MSGHVRAVQRALAILKAFSLENPQLSCSELSRKLKIHPSTIHRLLLTMEKEKIIDRLENGKYALGLKVFELGCIAAAQRELVKVARPYLEELHRISGETVNLVIMDGTEAIYLDKCENPMSMVQYARIGKRIPLYCSAVGKALLTGFHQEDLQRALNSIKIIPHTPNTIIDVGKLMEAVQMAKINGYAIDNEEVELGIKCIGAPVKRESGHVIAAISICGPVSRLSGGRFFELVHQVKTTAEKVSNRMGYCSLNALSL